MKDVCSAQDNCRLTQAERVGLEAVSIIGAVLSVFGLIATIITMLAFRYYRFSISFCLDLNIADMHITHLTTPCSVCYHYTNIVFLEYSKLQSYTMFALQKAAKTRCIEVPHTIVHCNSRSLASSLDRRTPDSS